MNLHATLNCLLMLVLGLPVGSLLLSWVAGLLAAMGDEAAATVLAHINTATRVGWLVALVGLVVVLGLEAVDRSRDIE